MTYPQFAAIVTIALILYFVIQKVRIWWAEWKELG